MATKLPKALARLQALEAGFKHDAKAFRRDPLLFLDRSAPIEDLEVFSFVVAGLSYGRVEQIEVSLNRLYKVLASLDIGPGGEGFAQFLRDFDKHKMPFSKSLGDWTHRLNTRDDIVALFSKLGFLLQEYGSLARLYQNGHDKDLRKKLETFCSHFGTEAYGKARAKGAEAWKGTGLSWFASSPESGSTCKRLLMWLRWMIRIDEPDLGLWREGSPLLSNKLPRPLSSELFFPVDTHVFQWARRNRVLTEKSPTWRSVEKITEYFKRALPEDPLRYDFLIAHLGMSEFRS